LAATFGFKAQTLILLPHLE